MNKLFLVSSMILLSLSHVAYANRLAEARCPTVDSIKITGWDMAKANEDMPGYWVLVKEKAYYDTDREWSFLLGQFKADNENDALDKGLNAVNQLSLKLGPLGEDNPLACYYKSDVDSELIGVAMTPPLDFSQDINKWMKQHVIK